MVLGSCMTGERKLPRQLNFWQSSSPTKWPFTCLRSVFNFFNLLAFFLSGITDEWLWLLQDEALLSDWKQQLDRDADTLKMKGNLNSLRTVRACNLPFTCLLIMLLLIILAVCGNLIFWTAQYLNQLTSLHSYEATSFFDVIVHFPRHEFCFWLYKKVKRNYCYVRIDQIMIGIHAMLFLFPPDNLEVFI